MIISVKPEPICVFYRSDGGYMASVRVILAATPQAAIAAVNQHVPIADSFPVSQPAGWSGGAMPTPKGIPGNDQVASVYAVSKGKYAIVAESNQAQSIKGRQMVVDTVASLKPLSRRDLSGRLRRNRCPDRGIQHAVAGLAA